MPEKWWKDKEKREEVLEELIKSQASFEELINSPVEDLALSDTMYYKMGVNPEGNIQAALYYIAINATLEYINKLGLNPRSFLTYAQDVKNLAEALSDIGVQSAEETKEALPILRETSKLLIQNEDLKDTVTKLVGQCADNVKIEAPLIILASGLGLDKDYVGKELDDLDI